MERFFLRWAINAVAIYAAFRLVPGIQAQSTYWVSIVLLALVFGLVNALLRPLIILLTCPFILLTLGLFTLVINTFLFWLTGWVGEQFGIGFRVAGFWPALLGGLVVSVVSFILSTLLRDELGSQRS